MLILSGVSSASSLAKTSPYWSPSSIRILGHGMPRLRGTGTDIPLSRRPLSRGADASSATAPSSRPRVTSPGQRWWCTCIPITTINGLWTPSSPPYKPCTSRSLNPSPALSLTEIQQPPPHSGYAGILPSRRSRQGCVYCDGQYVDTAEWLIRN